MAGSPYNWKLIGIDEIPIAQCMTVMGLRVDDVEVLDEATALAFGGVVELPGPGDGD